MAPSAPTHDYYVTLEVLPTTPHDVIKASYRRLARIHHPDKNIGCRLATAKTQLINAAWEVLSDEAKRSEYDRTRPQQKASSSSSRPGPPPAATPQSRYQPPPRPDTTAQDEARAQAESNKKRQEWLNYEKAQEEQIRQCQNILKPLEAEVDRLNSKIDENRKTLASDVPYAWNVFSFLSKRLSEQEKSEIRLASINAENAIRIKQIPLEKARKQLSQLNDELARRKGLEDTRLAAEKTEKARKERLAREKAEEARQREWARQQAERNKAAQEAAERWKQEQAKQAREAAERDRKERAAREARWKAAQEAAEKFRREQAEAETARQEQRKRAADAARKYKQRVTPTRNRGPAQNSARRNENSSGCRHKFWWNKIEGHNCCAHCTRSLYKFAEQCPGCDTIACTSCRHILKTGGTPSKIENYNDGNRRNAKPWQKEKYYTSGGYDEDYCDWD